MAGFSDFGGFGLLEFSSTDSAAGAIYRSLTGAVGDGLSTSTGQHVEASAYARALALADARVTLHRGYNQRRALYAQELLPALERTYSITPEPGDSDEMRRRRVAARQVLARGSTRDNLRTVLRTLLGDDFVRLYLKPPAAPPIFPSVPEMHGAWDDPAAAGRYFQLTETVVDTDREIEFSYENLLDDGERMAAGDMLCVQPENPHNAEAIQIASARGSGRQLARAVFSRPHEAGSIVRTHAPLWISTQRYIVVVVTPKAAADPTMRNRIHEAMRRLVRASTTWAIVQTTTLDGAPAIGPLGMTDPLGTSTLDAIPI